MDQRCVREEGPRKREEKGGGGGGGGGVRRARIPSFIANKKVYSEQYEAKETYYRGKRDLL